MLRGVWQASNCLSIHATHYVIIARRLQANKKWRPEYVKMAIFTARRVCIAQAMSWQDVRLSVKLTLFKFSSILCLPLHSTKPPEKYRFVTGKSSTPTSFSCVQLVKDHFKQTHHRRIFHQQQLICYLSYFHCHYRAMLCKRNLLSCSVSVCLSHS